MNKLFEKFGYMLEKIGLESVTAAQAMEATMKAIKDFKEEFVTDINVGNNGWIPVTERLPENNDNVRITVETHKGLEVAVGWYNHNKGKWKVCPSDDEEFYYCYSSGVIAWKENMGEPYNPEGDVPE